MYGHFSPILNFPHFAVHNNQVQAFLQVNVIINWIQAVRQTILFVYFVDEIELVYE